MDEGEEAVNVDGSGEGLKRFKKRGRNGSPETVHSKVFIIREIYDSENAYENFEQQLECALADCIETIVIEPMRLGDETARWISVGNCLHKTAVLAGIGSIVAAFIWPDKPMVFIPGTILTALCTGLYSISWQFDPCCKYQVETDPRELSRLALHSFNSSSPVVLVRKDDFRRKVLHSAVTILTLAHSGWKTYYPPMNRFFGSVNDIKQSSEPGNSVIFEAASKSV